MQPGVNEDLHPARHFFESLADYRARLKKGKAAVKEYLKGTPVWVSVYHEKILGPGGIDTGRVQIHKVQGTYRRAT